VINPWDEFAVEAALLFAEEHNGEVVVISMGEEKAKEALKHALAMGCSQAILISDPSLKGADNLVTAQVLAASVEKIGDADMVIFGKQAIDSDTGMTPAQVARLLGWPALSLATAVPAIDLDAKTIRVERAVEEGRQIVESILPAVLSVVKDYAEPRYPSFMGIRKASRTEIPVWSVADLGMDEISPSVSWPELVEPEKREVTCEIIDGESPEQIASILVEKIISEKVL
jgi:electron transfer flavoprotein beta subunit